MSRLFGALVAARTRLYDNGILPIRRLNHPVVSVGNLTTGGTGKTPLVMELARQFRDRGYRPVILSRGYRRKSRGVVIVSRGRGPEIDWTRSGDEPQLMAARLPGVAVVVGNSRLHAGKKAEEEDLGNLFLLDDGFQHRRLHRDVDIVAIDPHEWAHEARLLPGGPWREPKSAIGRADAACVQAAPGLGAFESDIPVFEVETIVDGLVQNGRIVPVESLKGTPVTAFAGIAKPDRFFNLLETRGLTLASRVAFPDHHAFRSSDLRRLAGPTLVTTEKDAIRLSPGDFYFLQISANIKRFNELHDLIRKRIERDEASKDRDPRPQLGR